MKTRLSAVILWVIWLIVHASLVIFGIISIIENSSLLYDALKQYVSSSPGRMFLILLGVSAFINLVLSLAGDVASGTAKEDKDESE